jgi:NAD(P)-dependent dehydrogenase (short-subunit alcohol dehydrogenase family)
MRRAGGGSIIITPSVAGLRGSAGLAGYCATKGGVRLFAKAVGMECAAEADGIRVNTVRSGIIDTPIWTKVSGSGGRNVPIDPNEMGQSRGANQRGWTGAGHREWRTVPRLRLQLHDGSGACYRRRHDGRRDTAPELRLTA